MTHIGKARRLRRLVDAAGRAVLIPMDHGVSNGPVDGLVDPRAAVAAVARGGATGVIVHKGLVRTIDGALGATPLLVHLSASTALNPRPNDKRLVGTVEECVALGADAVSIHVNVGDERESDMLEDFGRVSADCERLGMPLLAMMYPRGKDIRDPHAVENVKHVTRLAAELGADIVKAPYTGSVETFREVVRGCPMPVVISGGPRSESPEAFLRMVADARAAGGAGVSVGRNVWQHASPEAMTRAISAIVFKGASVDDALRALKA
ncbi:MAG TPA: 2-amino-3,7-dideoxy-D-threo-hept-6-ulosonate synthase [Candidatus Thermoplasmatota archaeon]|nr:2-amino-3,7-dideoxy-D-threo-hept-6-ulosonate synthase [Candidatus Thermoplasmatota archaeon]